MPRWIAVTTLMTAYAAATFAAQRPEWAFFVPSTEEPQKADSRPDNDPGKRWTRPGSRRSYSTAELHDPLNPPDWYPDEHPTLPDSVARGTSGGNGPPVLPCALCHLPNGAGHVESASLAGLPAEYIVQQFADWHSGARRIAVGDTNTTGFLSGLKQRYSQQQIAAAARYYSGLQPRPWIRVVESATVRRSAVDSETLMRLPIPGPKEPLGNRIVELPEDVSALLRRDSHSGFVAYVPVGSIAAGRVLVTTGAGGRTIPCADCHGVDLNGVADVPPLAGRPPTYMVRQLWAYQSGERRGAAAAPMQLVAAKLTPNEMLAIAAYLASRPPGRQQ
jgi:cytochrome c553